MSTPTLWISADLEGVAGLVVPEHMFQRGGEAYAVACRLMTDEVNAAVRGGAAAGMERALVNDAHGSGVNLVPERLDERAELLHGGFKPLVMAQGVETGVAAGVLLGYHGRAGTHGVVSHTWIGPPLREIRINGEPAGEMVLVAAVAAEHDVAIAVLTGDDVACAEARALLPGVRTVQTKRALNRAAAALRHPSIVCAEIEEVVRDALAAGEARPLRLPLPLAVEVEWATETVAHACALVPGVAPAGPRTVAYEAATPTDALQVFEVLTRLAQSVAE